MVFLSVGSPLQFKLVIARLNFQFQDALSMVNCLSTILAQKPNTTCETLSSGCFEESQECQFLLKGGYFKDDRRLGGRGGSAKCGQYK